MTAGASPVEKTIEQVVIDHLGDYTPVEPVPRDAGEPLEFRDLLNGSTFLVEIRALPSGG